MRTDRNPVLRNEGWSDKFRLRLQDILTNVSAQLFKVEEDSLIVTCSDVTTALTTGTAKVTFRFPWSFDLSAIRASHSTAQASGNIFTVDVNSNGSTILSTKITIDNTEKTSYTAATPPVISNSSIVEDDEITVDIDQIGTSGAKGLKVTFIGSRK